VCRSEMFAYPEDTKAVQFLARHSLKDAMPSLGIPGFPGYLEGTCVSLTTFAYDPLSFLCLYFRIVTPKDIFGQASTTYCKSSYKADEQLLE
jgi:hypothetical protein